MSGGVHVLRLAPWWSLALTIACARSAWANPLLPEPTISIGGRPIPVPAPAPTQPPAQFRRDTSAVGDYNTCGYITDNYMSPFACNTGTTCTNSGSIRGCCTSCSRSSLATNCLDATAAQCTAKTFLSLAFCCTFDSVYPYCNTYLWSTAASDVKTMFACEAYKTETARIMAASPDETSLLSAASGTTAVTSTGTGTGSSESGASTSDAASSSGSSSSSKTGAIAGGTIGGVLALALLAAGAFVYIRRRRRAGRSRDGVMELDGGSPSEDTKHAQRPGELQAESHVKEMPTSTNMAELDVDGRPVEMEATRTQYYELDATPVGWGDRDALRKGEGRRGRKSSEDGFRRL